MPELRRLSDRLKTTASPASTEPARTSLGLSDPLQFSTLGVGTHMPVQFEFGDPGFFGKGKGAKAAREHAKSRDFVPFPGKQKQYDEEMRMRHATEIERDQNSKNNKEGSTVHLPADQLAKELRAFQSAVGAANLASAPAFEKAALAIEQYRDVAQSIELVESMPEDTPEQLNLRSEAMRNQKEALISHMQEHGSLMMPGGYVSKEHQGVGHAVAMRLEKGNDRRGEKGRAVLYDSNRTDNTAFNGSQDLVESRQEYLYSKDFMNKGVKQAINKAHDQAIGKQDFGLAHESAALGQHLQITGGARKKADTGTKKQAIGNCTHKSLMLVLKDMLDEQDYVDFKYYMMTSRIKAAKDADVHESLTSKAEDKVNTWKNGFFGIRGHKVKNVVDLNGSDD